ncbi:hypothetical protein TWF281_005399 [Arthrobotrys megalospora]
MIFPTFAVLAGLVAVASASPVPVLQLINEDGATIDISPLQERAPPEDSCYKLRSFVSHIKAQSDATSFCSSFLSIGTETAFATQVVSTTATNTATNVVYTTVTVVARTNTLTLTKTDTIATLPTIVATSRVSSISVIVRTVTPPPTTVATTTIYTTPPVKREVQEREIENLPPWIRGFAIPAISTACGCLAIPSPVVTQTVTQYATETASVTETASSTDTALLTTETSVTSTIYTTLYVPTTTFTTSITVTTSTTTIASPSVTATVYRTLPTNCVNILSGNKLYTVGAPGRDIASGSSNPALQRYFAVRNEDTLSQCCGFIYENAMDASVFFFTDRGASAGDRRYTCYPFLNTGQVSTGISGICPKGVLPDNVPYVQNPGQTGFGLGPCWGKLRIA